MYEVGLPVALQKIFLKVVFIILKIMLKNIQSCWLTGLTIYLTRKEINKKMPHEAVLKRILETMVSKKVFLTENVLIYNFYNEECESINFSAHKSMCI